MPLLVRPHRVGSFGKICRGKPKAPATTKYKFIEPRKVSRCGDFLYEPFWSCTILSGYRSFFIIWSPQQNINSYGFDVAPNMRQLSGETKDQSNCLRPEALKIHLLNALWIRGFHCKQTSRQGPKPQSLERKCLRMKNAKEKSMGGP